MGQDKLGHNKAKTTVPLQGQNQPLYKILMANSLSIAK